MNNRKVGAPRGGFVHWFLIRAPAYLRQNYIAFYRRESHNYYVTRKVSRLGSRAYTLADKYMIARTSKKCWRVMAFDGETCVMHYKSFKKCIDVLNWIESTAFEWRKGRPYTSDMQYIKSIENNGV